MDYWNSLITEKSWEKLQQLKREGIDFILIGGWAVYLWAKSHKSKDIDIIVDYEQLEKLRFLFPMKKNPRLKKYEIHLDEIDVDIYVPYYSKLALPVEELQNHVAGIEGFKVVKTEALVLLKQAAQLARAHSEKGLKDRIDIIELLLNSNFDFDAYAQLVSKYSLQEYVKSLISIVQAFRETKYLALNPRQFKVKKGALLKKLKGLKV